MDTMHALDRFDSEELLALARSDFENKNLEGALAKLKEIIDRPEPLPDALAMLARLYAQLQLFAKAEQFFERYLELYPQSLLEQFELGMTRFDAGKFAPALQTWESLLQQHPDYPPALFYKGLLLARTGRSADAKQTLEHLLKGIAIDNLYFERAKKLLQAIEANADAATRIIGAQADKDGADDPRLDLINTYRTDH